ncbi:unnamed protein product [Cylicostephanus goldi]|uniref:Uncharacterized protein n=1 Tax=Cylicostephanus goldi TaxID=71465 RepID=A0A3P7QK57_CYLGO|nr:unnamed protein product [Cylicostephanus goldi]
MVEMMADMMVETIEDMIIIKEMKENRKKNLSPRSRSMMTMKKSHQKNLRWSQSLTTMKQKSMDI